MNTIKDIRFGLALCAGLLLLASTLAIEGEGAAVSNGVRDSGQIDKNTIDRETLVNRRFEFSWTSQEGGGVNGIATLKEDGSIEGIGSPNETTWLIDASGRLLFKHADGRVSTRYDKVWLEDGRLCFEGPFLFREGITHHLIEIQGAASEPAHEITPDQAARIKYSTQRFVYLDIGESCAFQLKNGTERQVSLLSVKEYEDPVIHLRLAETDRFEASYWPMGFLKELPSDAAKDFAERMKSCGPPLTVNCWHLNDFESAAMWNLYSEINKGIAIQSTFGALVGAFHRFPDDVHIGKIRYIDYRKDRFKGKSPEIFEPVMTKRKSFEHENELRAVI